jgi:hypothetical protein
MILSSIIGYKNKKIDNSIIKKSLEQCLLYHFMVSDLKNKDKKENFKNYDSITYRAGGKFRRWFISNAPIGYYCYEYPEEIQKVRNQYGAKVFFYRAQLIAGSIKLETKLYKDYAWVTRDEVSEYFDENMSEYIKAILPLV